MTMPTTNETRLYMASSCELGNRAGSVTGQILCSVHTRNFSPVNRDEIQETTKIVELIKLVSFTTVVSFVDSCNFIQVEIHTRQKLCHFGCYVAKAKLFCQKNLVLVSQAGVFIRQKIFILVTEISVATTEISVINRVSLASLMNTLKFLRRKEWRGKISETKPAPLTWLI